MQGIILINKPQGFTSFDVVAKLRGITGEKRIGHTGTLDPMATGVLPCAFGKATKLCEKLPCDDKTYVASLQLGVVTDTLDVTGTVLSSVPSHVTQEEFLAVMSQFVGDISQIPPMYSAISQGGQRLYDIARSGVTVERASRAITVYSSKLLSFDFSSQQASIEVSCSKGTYIRSLADDIGACLGVGACLCALVRTRANGFSLKDCHTLDELQMLRDQNNLPSALIEERHIFDALPKLQTGEWQKKMLSNGVPLLTEKFGSPAPGIYTLWVEDEFLGVYEIPPESDKIKMIYKG